VTLGLVDLLSKRRRLGGDEVRVRQVGFEGWEGRGCSFPWV
jgi:hypothetical protein